MSIFTSKSLRLALTLSATLGFGTAMAAESTAPATSPQPAQTEPASAQTQGASSGTEGESTPEESQPKRLGSKKMLKSKKPVTSSN